MKTIPLSSILAGIATLALQAAEIPLAAWKWEQTVPVEQPGLVRLELPPATLDASQADRADLRVVSPDGVAVPWALLEVAGPPVERLRAATEIKTVLENGTTVMSGRHEPGVIMAVTLQSPARDFLKSASVEVSEDGAVWRRVVQGEVVFRQYGVAERLRLSFPKESAEFVRVILDDSRSAPVAFVGFQVTLAEELPELVAQPATILSREELRGETRLVVGLGEKNLHVAELRLDVGDPLFSRVCSVALPDGPAGGGLPERVIGEAGLFRVGGPGGEVATRLAIPIHARIPTDTLVVRIRNGDSPPLEVRGLEAGRYRDGLVFYAGRAGDWKLLTGNAYAPFPQHDQAALRAELARGAGREVSPGPLVERAGHEPPAAVPGRVPEGRALDVSAWRHRRKLEAIREGVVRVELDAVTLAHTTSSGDLRDVRLIQNGRQLPWIEERGRVLRELRPAVAMEAVPKQATVSRWVLTLPAEGVPLKSLTADSPDSLFERNFRVSMEVRDSMGNPRVVRLGGAEWVRRPEARGGVQRLMIDLGNQRAGERLFLETDNGDNPPVRLEDVVLHYEAPLLVAVLPSVQPAYLYYGNPEAEAPNYDLQLVRAELGKADALAVVMGPEEALSAATRRRAAGTDVGSPWLWAALVGVVVILLVVVARLLPAAPAADRPPDGSGPAAG
jgi:hypothetical protein